MAANDIVALKANFEGWKAKRFPAPPPKLDLNEYYCIEQFTRPLDLSDSQLKTGMIGGPQDGGIDAFYILANGELVETETEIDPKDPPEFKLVIMQIKSDEGFSPVAIDKLYWFLNDLLDLSKKKADYHSTYKSDLIALMRLFKDKFGIVVGETPKLSIECIYSIWKDVEPNQDCNKSVAALKTAVTGFFAQAVFEMQFANAAAIWKQVQARPPKKKTLRWAVSPLSVQEGEVGLVRLVDFYNFITNEHGGIEERFFDSNVRGYWPTSVINRKIGETLRSDTSPEFWLLNNGVTILTDSSPSSNYLEIEIRDPQIVNGLQTSRQIHSYFDSAPLLVSSGQMDNDKRRVLVRIIKTDDKTVRDDVIRCTNSQNVMPDEALRATDAIHRQLEALFLSGGLYYDRRKGHYKDQDRPADQIVSVIEVLQAMLSIVLLRPDDARARPRNYVKNDSQYKSVFGDNQHPLTLYLRATQISRRIKEYLESLDLEPIHRRNMDPYLTMYCAMAKIENWNAIPSKLLEIKATELKDAFLDDCYGRVYKQYEKLAQKLTESEEGGYDQAAKGPNLSKALIAELKRRFRPAKKKK